jgi:catechol 2,3-dioxygenase-like lactoylglutathione lyase family enzyme
MPIRSVGHIGFCVSDLDRSLRFWRDGMGFEVLREFEFYGRSWKRVLELDDLDLQTRIIRRDDMMLEIMHFRKPDTLGTRERSPMNQLGFTHLAIWATDIAEVAQRVVDYGGSVIESARTIFDHPKIKGEWLICTDPDGIRVEFVDYPAGAAVLQREKSESRV